VFNTLVIRDPLNRVAEAYDLDLQDRPVAVTNLEGQVMRVNYGLGSFVRFVTRFDGTTVSNTFDTGGRVPPASHGQPKGVARALRARVNRAIPYTKGLRDAEPDRSSKKSPLHPKSAPEYPLRGGDSYRNPNSHNGS
jgi:hypothetical protein